MRYLLIAIALAIATVAPASASDKADVMETVHHWTDAFDRQTFNTDAVPCAEDAVVIDDLPPHVWQGPGACSKWFNAVAAWTRKAAVTDAVIKLGKLSHFDLNGEFAYLVSPVTLSYVKAGKAIDFPGTLTMTLRKERSGWRVSGVAWADH